MTLMGFLQLLENSYHLYIEYEVKKKIDVICEKVKTVLLQIENYREVAPAK